LLGVLWHAALVLVSDGVQRFRYRLSVHAISALPLPEQSAARADVRKRIRRCMTPFGRAFAEAWQHRFPGRGLSGRAWVSNRVVNLIGAACVAVGSMLLLFMSMWILRGHTSPWLHMLAAGGGTVGGLGGGALCRPSGLRMTILGHMAGSALGGAGLAGMAALGKKL
jgi:hypothetical protein